LVGVAAAADVDVDFAEVVLVDDVVAADDGLADVADRVDGVAAADAEPAEGVTSAAGVAATEADLAEPAALAAAGALDVVADLVDDFAAAEVFLAVGVFAGSFSADLASTDLVSADLVSADLVSADLARVAFGVDVGFGSGLAAEMRDVRAARVGCGLWGSPSPSPVFVGVAALAATDSAAFRHAAGAGRPAPKVGSFPWDVISRLPSTRACAWANNRPGRSGPRAEPASSPASGSTGSPRLVGVCASGASPAWNSGADTGP
jgi:hypothetical protein